MSKLNIYVCKSKEMSHIPGVVEKHNIDYELSNADGVKMGELAEMVHLESKSKWASVPFCHTMEGQCFGTKVSLDYVNGNRIIEYPVNKLEDIDEISIDKINSGKIDIISEAVKYLKVRGIPAAVNVVGPVTLATSILPAEEVYRGMAKSAENMEKLFNIVEGFLTRYIDKLLELDVDLLSYADPTGTLDILGTRLYKKVAGPSFVRVLDKINSESNTMIYLCPKVSTSLLAVDMIEEDERGRFWSGSCISSNADINTSRRYRVRR